MGFFGMLFWIVVVWFLIRAWRRSERCLPVGSGGYGQGWYSRPRESMPDRPRQQRPDERQDYIDSLESRISELEERLDFTERLLSGKAVRSEG
jgi:hypothetical protein